MLRTTVVGGFSKLLKHAIKLEQPQFVISFVDQRYGSGDYLQQLGFEKESEHVSFVWVKNNRTYHRMIFPGNSGYENGAVKLWDCGQAKWILKL